MLPLFRLSFFGIVFATFAVLIGFGVPEATRPLAAQTARISPIVTAQARGALIDTADHPEWKQFLVLAAFERATQLERLRELPDTIHSSTPPGDAVATLPTERSEAEPEDATGSVTSAPEAVLPVEIGAASSSEIEVGEGQITPPVQKPESLKRPESTRKMPRKLRKVRAKNPNLPPAVAAETASNPFATLFGAAEPEKKTPGRKP